MTAEWEKRLQNIVENRESPSNFLKVSSVFVESRFKGKVTNKLAGHSRYCSKGNYSTKAQ